MKRWRGAPRHLLRVAFSPLHRHNRRWEFEKHLHEEKVQTPSEWQPWAFRMDTGRMHHASFGDRQERVNCFPTTSCRRTAVVMGQAFTLCSRASQVWRSRSKRAFSSKEQKCTHISSRRREPTGWIQGRGAQYLPERTILCGNITVSLLYPSGRPGLWGLHLLSLLLLIWQLPTLGRIPAEPLESHWPHLTWLASRLSSFRFKRRWIWLWTRWPSSSNQQMRGM